MTEHEHEEECVPVLTVGGWQAVEDIERMLSMKVPIEDICTALDLTPRLISLLLAQAKVERLILEEDARDL